MSAMRVLGIWLAVCVSATASGTRWIALTSADPSPPRLSVVAQSPGLTRVQLQVPGYWEVRGAHGLRVVLEGDAVTTLEPGAAQVPRVVTHLELPASGGVAVTVRAMEGVTRVVPDYTRARLERRPPVGDDQTPLTLPATGSQTVAAVSGDWYPAAAATLGEPFIFRTWRGVALHLFPCRYQADTGVLQISSNLLVEVRTDAGPGPNPLQVVPVTRRRVPEFEQMAEHLFARREGQAPLSYTHLSEVGPMVIIAADAYVDAVQPLLAWKRQKGIPTSLVPVSTIGNTVSNIQAFVLNHYLSNGLAYVCLVGDADQLAYPTGTKGIMNNGPTPADPRYGLLVGSDYYPEVIVSRFPGRTVAEISNMVSRTIRYERDASTNDSWRARGCGIGAAQDLASDGFYDYQRVEHMRAMLTNFTYTSVDQIYDPGANLATLTNALNAGRGLVNYQGHGDATSFGTPGVPRRFTTSTALGLRNENQLPCVYITGCRAGQFHLGSDCMAEAWLKGGSASAPHGAVAVFAASHDQYLVPPTVAQQDSVALLVGGLFHSIGALWANGLMKAVSAFPHVNPDPPGTVGEELYEQMHIFGDGSLSLYTARPTRLLVQHAGVHYAGQSQYSVRVPGVSGALCALYAPATGELISSAYTDGSGQVSLVLEDPWDPADLLLTVTAFNRVPMVSAVSYRAQWDPGLLLKVW